MSIGYNLELAGPSAEDLSSFLGKVCNLELNEQSTVSDTISLCASSNFVDLIQAEDEDIARVLDNHGFSPTTSVSFTQNKSAEAAKADCEIARILNAILLQFEGDAIFYFDQGDRLLLRRINGALELDDEQENFWLWHASVIKCIEADYTFSRLPNIDD